MQWMPNRSHCDVSGILWGLLLCEFTHISVIVYLVSALVWNVPNLECDVGFNLQLVIAMSCFFILILFCHFQVSLSDYTSGWSDWLWFYVNTHKCFMWNILRGALPLRECLWFRSQLVHRAGLNNSLRALEYLDSTQYSDRALHAFRVVFLCTKKMLIDSSKNPQKNKCI